MFVYGIEKFNRMLFFFNQIYFSIQIYTLLLLSFFFFWGGKEAIHFSDFKSVLFSFVFNLSKKFYCKCLQSNYQSFCLFVLYFCLFYSLLLPPFPRLFGHLILQFRLPSKPLLFLFHRSAFHSSLLSLLSLFFTHTVDS